MATDVALEIRSMNPTCGDAAAFDAGNEQISRDNGEWAILYAEASAFLFG